MSDTQEIKTELIVDEILDWLWSRQREDLNDIKQVMQTAKMCIGVIENTPNQEKGYYR